MSETSTRALATAILLTTLGLAAPASAQAPVAAEAQPRGPVAATTGSPIDRLATDLWGCVLSTRVLVDLGGGGPTAVRASAEDRACVSEAIRRSLDPTSFSVRTRLVITRTDGIVEVRREILEAPRAHRSSRGRPLAPHTRQGRLLLFFAPGLLLGSGLAGAGAALAMNPLPCFSISGCGPRPGPNQDVALGLAVASGIFVLGAIGLFAAGGDLLSRGSAVRLTGGAGDVGLGLEASF